MSAQESVIRIVLKLEDFKRLVSGEVVNYPKELICAIEGKELWRFKIQISLGEMTFGVMKHLIEFEEQRAK